MISRLPPHPGMERSRFCVISVKFCYHYVDDWLVSIISHSFLVITSNWGLPLTQKCCAQNNIISTNLHFYKCIYLESWALNLLVFLLHYKMYSISLNGKGLRAFILRFAAKERDSEIWIIALFIHILTSAVSFSFSGTSFSLPRSEIRHHAFTKFNLIVCKLFQTRCTDPAVLTDVAGHRQTRGRCLLIRQEDL